MATAPTPELPQPLVEFMQRPRITVVTTHSPDGPGVTCNVISWVLARDPRTIRMMGDSRTRWVQNLKADPRVALVILGAEGAWTVYGQARILADPTPGVPLRLALIEVTDLQVYSSMFWGARLTQVPEWEVTYDPAQAEKLDQQVFAAMREFSPQPPEP